MDIKCSLITTNLSPSYVITGIYEYVINLLLSGYMLCMLEIIIITGVMLAAINTKALAKGKLNHEGML